MDPVAWSASTVLVNPLNWSTSSTALQMDTKVWSKYLEEVKIADPKNFPKEANT